MKCIKCKTLLSAGDITLNGGVKWVIMCPECDTIQPHTVVEEPDGIGFTVVIEGSDK